MKLLPSLPLLSIALLGCSRWTPISFSSPVNRSESRLEQVVRVTDGDTLVLRSGEKVRLCGVDAPEKQQPLGQQAQASLQRLIDRANGTIILHAVEHDRYGRTIADVFVSAKNPQQPEEELFLNAEQLLAGMAYVYPQYVNRCPDAGILKDAEQQAQATRKGVWAGKYQKPWEYRRR